MTTSNEIHDKAETIAESAIKANKREDLSTAGIRYAACLDLAMACALLTSTSKDEREKGKQMARRWKNGNSF